MPARIFLRSDRWLKHVLTGLRAIHQGFWLGILDREALHVVAESEYSSQTIYRTLYHNLSGLFPWEETVVSRFFRECHSVLLGAAGGGREMIALSRRGMQVDGFECSGELVEVSRHLVAMEGIDAKVMLSPPDRVPEGLGTYDGLIMGWGGYNHIMGRETRVRFLDEFRHHVRPGGPILLSFVIRKPESRHYRLIVAIARLIRFLRRSPEAIELGDALVDAHFHFFTQDEIRQELEDSGFQLEYYSELGFGHAVGRAKNSADTHVIRARAALEERTNEARHDQPQKALHQTDADEAQTAARRHRRRQITGRWVDEA